MDWLGLLAMQGTFKSFLQHHSSKASILQCSAFFIVQLSRPYMTTGKAIALTRRTLVGVWKVQTIGCKTAYKNVLYNMGTKPIFYKNCKWAVNFKKFTLLEEKSKRNQYAVKEPDIWTKI